MKRTSLDSTQRSDLSDNVQTLLPGQKFNSDKTKCYKIIRYQAQTGTEPHASNNNNN